MSAGRHVTFGLAGLWFGVPITTVREVLPAQPVTPVPMAADAIAGLLNLRGQVVTVVDPRWVLNLPVRPDIVAPVHVVLEHAGELRSLMVDNAGDVVDINTQSHDTVPQTVSPALRAYLLGAEQIARGLLLLLDVQRLLSVPAAVKGTS